MKIYCSRPTERQLVTVRQIVPHAQLELWCRRTRGKQSIWELSAPRITDHQITLLRFALDEVYLNGEDFYI